ncbi:MAG: hypothetical protein E7329_09655 [Clostridiales bacterium]|nr:hypothetical protein [Clostridiales bacterium]
MRTFHFCKRFAAFLVLAVMLLVLPAPSLAALESDNPLVDPKPITEYAQTEDEFLNVLLLGIDYGFDGYWGSGGKKVLDNCHTDAIMVFSVNLTKQQIYFLSLPRDTLTYIPGVKGIYKLNAAVNCAEDMAEGMERICAAASWLLGGIKIDKYVAVDMNALIRLCDAMKGVDFDMDMAYTGSSGRYYYKGFQHLDGTGIMDYVRARHNATVDANDIGRTGRQREMMMALFKKLKKNIGYLNPLLAEAQEDDINIFRNVHTDDVMNMVPMLMKISESSLASRVLTGNYRFTLVDWNFTITDQENRMAVLKEVFGIDAEPLKYTSLAYTKWLTDSGMPSVRNIEMARLLIAHGEQLANPTPAQQEALQKLIAAHDALVEAFDQAANSMTEEDTEAMVKARGALRDVGEEADDVLGYPETLSWRTMPLWYRDPLINEYPDVQWS